MSARLPAYAALFVVSGAAGLVYEVVWTRDLVRVFGVTAFAVSTVLVSFMGGMALGAAWIGARVERVRRPLRLFALLETGIGAYALVLPWLLRGADYAYELLLPSLPEAVLPRSMVRFALSALVLLVPTVLMGGTLPALGQGLLRREGAIGRGVALLYFVNTLGAAVGCWAAGFHLIPGLGLRGTTWVAAGGNAAVAVAAWWLDRGALRAADVAEPAAAGPARVVRTTSPEWWPLAVVFGSGMAALAFEIVWFRVLVLTFGSTVYSFSAMLAAFLVGLALGSLAVGPLADRARAPVRLLALIQGAAAAFALGGYLMVNRMPGLFLRVIGVSGLDFEGMNRTKLLLSTLTLIPPAAAFGATFPVAVRLYRSGSAAAGRRIGRVYGWNTLGAIAGSFGAGFLLLPAIGAEWLLRSVVLLLVALAFGSLLAEPGPLRRRWALPAGAVVVMLVASLVFAPRWDRRLLGAGVYFEPTRFLAEDGRPNLTRVLADYDLQTFTEGYNDTIISYESPGGKFITVNGSPTASDQFEDMFSQRMMGHLPMAMHPGPVRKACIVGLGAGVTAGAIGLYEELDELVAVELERGVQVASRFFQRENDGVLDNPRVRLRIDDGRNYLKLTDERFDVISSHPNFPSLAGSGVLFSRDYFELCRARLAPGGVMCHYAPLWRIRDEDVRTIVGSFTDVFPHVRVFSAGVSLILLGREEPLPPVDFDELSRRVARPAVRASLRDVGVRGPVELLSFYRFDENAARDFAGDAPRTTDDRPRIEFTAPRGLFSRTVGPNLEELARHTPPREQRLARLGLAGEYAESFLVLAEAYDTALEAEIALDRGDHRRAMQLALPVAESGHGLAGFLVADFASRNGRALQAERKLEEARESFLLALRFAPDSPEALIGAAHVDLFLGRLDEAERLLLRAVERWPRSGWAHSLLGILRELQGDFVAAEASHRRAVAIQPRLARARALLGRLLLATGRAEQALGELIAAERLGETSEGVLAGIADALTALGREREALRRARRAVRARPESTAALEALARAARASGRAAEADEALRRRDALGDRGPATSFPVPGR